MNRRSFFVSLLTTLGACVAWWLYARALGIRPTGWWAYPSWWRPYLPSYFQIAAIGLPFVLRLALPRSLRPTVDTSLATVVGAVVLFPQNPLTDVAFITTHPLFSLAVLAVGSAVPAMLSAPLRPWAPVLFAGGLSVLVLPSLLLRAYDAHDVFGTIWFYLLHLALPAQTAALLISRHSRSGATNAPRAT